MYQCRNYYITPKQDWIIRWNWGHIVLTQIESHNAQIQSPNFLGFPVHSTLNISQAWVVFHVHFRVRIISSVCWKRVQKKPEVNTKKIPIDWRSQTIIIRNAVGCNNIVRVCTNYSYKLKHRRLVATFIEEATQKRQSKEHCMCIKQKQNISSQSFLHNPSTLKSSFQFVWYGPKEFNVTTIIRCLIIKMKYWHNSYALPG